MRGLRADRTPYTAIMRRRCRCLDCGQVRIDKGSLGLTRTRHLPRPTS